MGLFKSNFLRRAKKFSPFEVREYIPYAESLVDMAEPVNKRHLGLKLVLISDTHGYLTFGDRRLETFLDKVGEFDLCLILGDLDRGDLDRIVDCIPRERICCVPGNHDIKGIYKEYGIRNLEGRVIKYKGVKIAGIGGSFRYKEADFPSHTQYESIRLADSMKAADILITHDISFNPQGARNGHEGLVGITKYICENRVQWHFHGHIHNPYTAEYPNGTRERSVLNLDYIEV